MGHFWAIVSMDPYCRTSLPSVHPYLTLTLTLSLTLNLTLISSYLTNKHQYTQPNMSANWMTSRLRDQSVARCKNCRPVPTGYTDNSLECADLSVRAILTITFTHWNNRRKQTLCTMWMKMSNQSPTNAEFVGCIMFSHFISQCTRWRVRTYTDAHFIIIRVLQFSPVQGHTLADSSFICQTAYSQNNSQKSE